MGDAEDFFLCQVVQKPGFGKVERETIKRPLDLPKIMHGLLCELEAWDVEIAVILKTHTPFTPYHEGVVLLQHRVSGQAECDWCVGDEVIYQEPTQELIEECQKYKSRKGSEKT